MLLRKFLIGRIKCSLIVKTLVLTMVGNGLFLLTLKFGSECQVAGIA